jgi:hypothetical protein
VGQTKSVTEHKEGLNASLEAPELEAVLWENPTYGILEGALETGLWRICTGTKPETVDTDIDGLRLLRQCSTRRAAKLSAGLVGVSPTTAILSLAV